MFVVSTWQVNVVEGPKGSCLIRNLTTHVVKNEEQAQSWLQQGMSALLKLFAQISENSIMIYYTNCEILGQANRKMAETPMNQRSSRSHAVFTIYLNAKKKNSDVIVK